MLVSRVPASGRTRSPDEERRRELADFLKMKRSALSPNTCGLHVSQRRRSKGLLREEVAQRAGTSLTWYTWLEQGREIQASPELIDRLAQALRLTEAEHQHLRRLARPEPRRNPLTTEAPQSLSTWIEGLDPQPAYALNGIWDVIAWNAAACDLLGDFEAVAPEERNLLRLLFLSPHWRMLFIDWEDIANSAVAQFRSAMARLPDTMQAQALVHRLSAECSEFSRMWQQGAVAGSELRLKRMRHCRHGEIALSFASVRPEGLSEDISVTIYAQPL